MTEPKVNCCIYSNDHETPFRLKHCTYSTVSEDLDGIPLKGVSSPLTRRDRKRETKSSKWETPTPVVTSSKWDNIDQETEPSEPSKKKTKSRHDEDIFADVDYNKSSRSRGTTSDEDVDGAPLDDSSPDATRQSCGSRYQLYITKHVSSNSKLDAFFKERGSARKTERS